MATTQSTIPAPAAETQNSSSTEQADSIDWDSYPRTIAHIAAGLGLRPEPVWAYLSAALGGMAGPGAHMFGILGEAHSPTVPLVLAVQHPGAARLLDQVAVEPAVHFNDWHRRQSQAFFPDWYEADLNHLPHGIRQEHSELVGLVNRSDSNAEEIAEKRRELLHRRQVYQPAVLLNSPSPATFDKLLGSVFDEAPLIRDTGGALLRNSLTPGPAQRDWRELLRRIVEGARGGTDQPAGRREHGPGRLDDAVTTRSPFIMHLPGELVGRSLLDPATANVFEVAIIIPTAKLEGRLQPSLMDAARQLLNAYRQTVNQVLWARFDDSGVDFQLSGDSTRFIDACFAVDDKLDRLPAKIRRYCGGLYDLPLRLLWAALALGDTDQGTLASITKSVIATTHWCIDQQVSLIREALDEEADRLLHDAAVVMLDKLRALPKPCKLSELLRRYHRQNKDQHLPVLGFLEAEGLVEWRPEEKQINLVECLSPPQWLNVSPRQIA